MRTQPYFTGERATGEALFEQATRDSALRSGLVGASAKGTGLLLRRVVTPEAVASLCAAAKAYALTSPTEVRHGHTSDSHAIDAARNHDVSQWWRWSFPVDAPSVDSDEDEYLTADAVQQLMAEHDALRTLE